MILILTDAFDPHVDYVSERLRERGAELFRLNPAQFPSEAELSVRLSATGEVQHLLRLHNEVIDLGHLTSVWYRRPKPPVAHEEIGDPRCRQYVEEESLAFVDDIWNGLDYRWVPAPPAVLKRAKPKGSQLKLAGALGFELPPTLITNSPDEFLEFYRRHNGNIISKPVDVALDRHLGDTYSRYTEVVSKRDVGYARMVRYCPVIFQAYVPKRVELRITVVGRKVFAAEIHSQVTHHTRHDWRRYDTSHTPHFPHTLPPDVEQRCVQLVERLGLCYGAIDMVVTPDNRYVFLEINPNGQYIWIEELTGLPITDALCDLLMDGNTPASQSGGLS